MCPDPANRLPCSFPQESAKVLLLPMQRDNEITNQTSILRRNGLVHEKTANFQ